MVQSVEMKVCFETFGCRLNKAEALQMEANYLADGWKMTTVRDEADLFVVRGCSVTAKAQSDCEKLIAHLRHTYPNAALRICGCLPKQEETGSSPLQSLGETASSPLPSRTARAYLKVQDGCCGTCTFCIVPRFRGKSRSVPFTDVLDTAKRFIDAGYHEIVITGCNLALYASEGKRLPELMGALAEVNTSARSGKDSASPFRIRLGSLEPGGCAQDVVRCMAEHANICRFLHIPIQSGSDRILAAMNRPYRLSDIRDLLDLAVRLLPSLGLGCDLMTGFPGETEDDFAATRELLTAHPFSNAHVFPYSERPGTPAAEFPDAIPPTIRASRAQELSLLAKAKREDYARSFVGQTVDVVIEGHDKAVGWTGEYLRCEADAAVPRKSLVRIRVTHADGERLCGLLQAAASLSARDG